MSSSIQELTEMKGRMRDDLAYRVKTADIETIDRAIVTIMELRELVAKGKKAKAGLGTQNVTGPLSDTEEAILSILKNRPEIWQTIYQLREMVNARGLLRNYQQVQRETSKLLGRGLIEAQAEAKGPALLYRWVQ